MQQTAEKDADGVDRPVGDATDSFKLARDEELQVQLSWSCSSGEASSVPEPGAAYPEVL